MIEALRDPSRYDHPVESVEVIETHISWILLTGEYAYKLKKPVDYGFVDFSTLERRQRFCAEEVRLNRRSAPELYLDVVAITGTEREPVIGGAGPVLEYAVRMRQFPQEAQLDRMLAAGAVDASVVEQIALAVAAFHAAAEVAAPDDDFGTPERAYAPVAENFEQIRGQGVSGRVNGRLQAVETWAQRWAARHRDLLAERKARGFVRECHGDLHLGNIAWLNSRPLLFDCIEFEPYLRWIDVISDVAFVAMDLAHQGVPRWSFRLLNRYLQETGDYRGVGLLPFYMCYRAMVRAKVAALRGDMRAFDAYLERAETYVAEPAPILVATRGLSASGKTTVSTELMETLSAVRVRSDVERKRLHGISASDSAAAGVDQDLYSSAVSERTYDRLAELAGGLLGAGLNVIVDAACLKARQRERLHDVARNAGVPFVLLDLTASADTLRERIRTRERGASDAGADVLEHQLATHEPLSNDERKHAVLVDTEAPLDALALAEQVRVLASS